MEFNYHEFADLLSQAIMKAEDDPSNNLVIIETLMCSVAKVCKMTLDAGLFDSNSRTRAVMVNLMSELVAAMLRDYLDMENRDA